MSDMDELPVMAGFDEPERRPKSRGNWLIATGMVITTAAVATLVGLWAHANGQVNDARQAQHRAVAALKVEKAKPPRTVTKTVTKVVPTYGKSVLMGIFAQGAIQGGVFDGNGNESFTPNDSTCSYEYTSLSNQYTSVTIDRSQFMTACEGSLNLTMKRDSAS